MDIFQYSILIHSIMLAVLLAIFGAYSGTHNKHFNLPELVSDL